MQVAQIMQHGAVFIAHAAREVRISQAAVARGLRHVLQHAELLLNDLLALPGNLPPPRHYVVLNVVALLRPQVAPGIFLVAEIGALLRAHAVPLIELITNAVLLLRRKILKRSAVLQHAIALRRRQVAHAIHKWRL